MPGPIVPTPDKLPPPSPTRAVANRQLAVGAGLILVAVASLGAGAAGVAALPVLGVGAFFLYFGVLLRLSGDAVPAVNTAYNAALEGRGADAERILDGVEGRFQLGYIRRVVDVQRANLALRRGDLDTALARADAAIARPVGLFTGSEERPQIAGARGLKALILASKGEASRAREEIAAVRAVPEAGAEALARAAAAEAVILERAGERDALSAHLSAERRLLFDSTAPRERAVMRAYRRMLKAPRTSIYRRAAPREAERHAGSEPSVADWIAQIAPAAAPFARARASAAKGATEAPAARATEVEPGLRREAEERLRGKGAEGVGPPAGRLVGLWVLLIVIFVGIWQILSPGPVEAVPAPVPEPGEIASLGTWALGLLPAALAAFVGVLIARNLRRGRGLAAALSALARGDAGAEARLQTFVHAPQALVVGQAHLHLARLAEKRGEFEAALAHCDRGISAVAAKAGIRALASAMLLPDLVAERALILAATGRDQQASAEMAAVAEAFPAYPFHAPAALRVALVQRARRGDLEGAARLADGRSEDVPLPQRDETLADVVRALAHPEDAGAGEIERLEDDLRSDPELRGWLAAVAPAAVAAFARSGAAPAGVRVAAPGPSAEVEAEREALAEQEAVGRATARAPG
jgi:hypothetical protein